MTGRRPATPTAADRIRRMFGRFIGAGYLFYLVFTGPTAVEQMSLTEAWWTPAAFVAIFGTGIALGGATFLPDVRWVTRLAAANAIAYLIAAVLWWVAWTGEPSMEAAAWQSLCPGVAGLAAALAWRPRVTVGYLVTVVPLVQFANYVLLRDTAGYVLVPESAFALTFCGVFAAAAMMAMRTGHVLDATIATTHDAVAAAAAADAKAVERERFDALVHDQVMSTLLASGREGAERLLAVHARRALDMFDSLRRGTGSDSVFGADQVLAQFRSAASDIDEDVVFTETVCEHCRDRNYPAEPVRVMASALAEVVRNSVRHAGVGATRNLHVEMELGQLRATVSDNGKGFDPGAVAPHRMGIRASVRGRMAQLEGGDAAVVSAPGAGTIVALTWKAPARSSLAGPNARRT